MGKRVGGGCAFLWFEGGETEIWVGKGMVGNENGNKTNLDSELRVSVVEGSVRGVDEGRVVERLHDGC